MNVAVLHNPAASVAAAIPIRVMIVDDSAVVRALVARWLESEPSIAVVASLGSGREALDRLVGANPDVVVLDVEMPDLDGIAALPLLLEKKPDLAVIIASTLTRRNAEVSLKALALGALDCIPKPEAGEGATVAIFRNDLIAKVRELGLRARRRRAPAAPLPLPAAPEPAKAAQARRAPKIEQAAAGTDGKAPALTLRPWPRIPPRVLLIGSSTGGPQALTKVMSGLVKVSECTPILITQHMPPTFTMILAEHLARMSGRPVREAEDGEAVLAGRVYMAPGGKHMRVARRDGNAVIALDDAPPIHFCRPAVDPLFSSAAQIWGAWVLGVILTGMGTDGTQGASDIVASGGAIIAQDEATSVVWGMPGSAAETGLCSAVLPLDAIAEKISHLFLGDRN